MADRDLEQAHETLASSPPSSRVSRDGLRISRDATDREGDDRSFATAAESSVEKGDSRTSPDTKESVAGPAVEAVEREEDEDDESYRRRLQAEIASGNPFTPEPNAFRESQFTLRSLLVGLFCGALVGASNLYLGLRSGNSVGGGIFGAIAGFAILSTLSRVLPRIPGSDWEDEEQGKGSWWRRFFKLGGRFGPKENVTITCCATAAGSNGVAFFSAVPALYQLHLLGESPRQDFGRLLCLAAVCAYWGMFFSVPFRKLYVLDLKLAFPGAVANAVTIRTLHTSRGAEENKRRIRALIIAFAGAFVWRVTSEYAPGILWSQHIFWGLYKAGVKGAIGGDNWTWYTLCSPAFVAVGMVIGSNAAASIAIGQVFAWGIIGPALVATGQAAGTVAAKTLPDFIIYTGVTPPIDGKPCAPRYWLLWPGTLLVLTATFTELACNGKTFVRSLQRLVRRTYMAARSYGRRGAADEKPEQEDLIYDPAPMHERIPAWVWLPGAVIVGIFSVAVMSASFDQPVGTSILTIILALLFSFITCEGLGRLAIGVSGETASTSQMIQVGYGKSQHYPPAKTAYSSTLAAAITNCAGQQTADMVTDLKTAHLLGASPRSMFFAQVVGAVVATFLSPSLFVLFTDVYPCILSSSPAEVATCSFQVPSAASLRAIASLGGVGLNIPLGSGLFAIFISLFAAATIVAKNFYLPKRYHVWIPSWIAVGLGFLVPFAAYSVTFGVGALIMVAWRRKNPIGALLFYFPIAAGLISGEGIGGIMSAILQIAGVGGSTHGSTLGCPWGLYCG